MRCPENELVMLGCPKQDTQRFTGPPAASLLPWGPVLELPVQSEELVRSWVSEGRHEGAPACTQALTVRGNAALGSLQDVFPVG